MKVGFTGTREGMSSRQRRTLTYVLGWLMGNADDGDSFHHGDEPHSDQDAARITKNLWPNVRVVKHRPKQFTSKELLGRNWRIVKSVDILIAAPRTDKETIRSGTWATVRYARILGLPVVMLPRGGGKC